MFVLNPADGNSYFYMEGMNAPMGSYGGYGHRVLAATVDGVRLVCVYCPNGQAVGSEKYEYKLRWMERLRVRMAEIAAVNTSAPINTASRAWIDEPSEPV